jgi:arsenate reductase
MNIEYQGSSKQTVLFLCTGNSCRSQLAEAIVNSEMGTAWQAISAGTKPAGYVHPLAIKVLSEIGIEHQGHSKNATQFLNEPIHLVVTVCDSAAEDCPVWLGSNPQVHLAFEDPAAFEGDEYAKLEKFRQVRDEIAEKIPGLLIGYTSPAS